MFRIDKCQSRSIPETQYVQSVGVADMEEIDGQTPQKVITYFFPSMVFPNRVEILSITLLCKCKHKEYTEEKVVKIAIQDNKNPNSHPIDLGEDYYLIHKVDEQAKKSKKLITTFKFPTTIVIDPDQPFYFYTKDDMDSSALVMAFRNTD